MNCRTHIAGGVTASALTLIAMPTTPEISLTAFSILLGATGATLPDIDSHTSKPRHIVNTIRTFLVIAFLAIFAYSTIDNPWMQSIKSSKVNDALDVAKSLGTHFLIPIIIILVAVYAGTRTGHRTLTHSLPYAALLTYSIYLLSNSMTLTTAFGAGILSHIVLDLLNTKPVHILYPLKSGVCFKVCSVQSSTAKVIGGLLTLSMFVTLTIAIMKSI